MPFRHTRQAQYEARNDKLLLWPSPSSSGMSTRSTVRAWPVSWEIGAGSSVGIVPQRPRVLQLPRGEGKPGKGPVWGSIPACSLPPPGVSLGRGGVWVGVGGAQPSVILLGCDILRAPMCRSRARGHPEGWPFIAKGWTGSRPIPTFTRAF